MDYFFVAIDGSNPMCRVILNEFRSLQFQEKRQFFPESTKNKPLLDGDASFHLTSPSNQADIVGSSPQHEGGRRRSSLYFSFEEFDVPEESPFAYTSLLLPSPDRNSGPIAMKLRSIHSANGTIEWRSAPVIVEHSITNAPPEIVQQTLIPHSMRPMRLIGRRRSSTWPTLLTEEDAGKRDAPSVDNESSGTLIQMLTQPLRACASQTLTLLCVQEESSSKENDD